MHQGGCECKSIRYEFSGEPLTCYACHCTDCQTSTGSAFALSMIIKANNMKILKGEPGINLNENNGTEVQRHHCPQCGMALWYSADAYPGIIALKPGTFDDTTWFEPIAHLWMRSAQPWIILKEDAITYEKQPEMSELMALWANRNHEADTGQ